MSQPPSYIQGADLPNLTIEWLNQDGDIIDFSSGYTFSLKLGTTGQAATITKTTGITGAATSPNITIAWATTAELNTISHGTYVAQLTATRTGDSKQRIITFDLIIKPAIT